MAAVGKEPQDQVFFAMGTMDIHYGHHEQDYFSLK